MNISYNLEGSTWLLGDLHMQKDTLLRLCKEYDIRNSNIIILGDCGVGLRNEHPNKFYNYLSKQLALRNNTLYLVRGNHDNPRYWCDLWFSQDLELNAKNAHKNLLEEKWPNIIHIDDEFILINQKLYYVYGGAVSIDRVILKTGSTYFEDERTTSNIKRIISDFEPSTKVHGILAHTGPRPEGLDAKMLQRRCAVDKRLKDDLIEENCNIDNLIFALRPAEFYYGHFHVSWEGNYTPANNGLSSCLNYYDEIGKARFQLTDEPEFVVKCKCLNICELYKLY